MVTPGCCCWYLAKARSKNGASKVDPAPVRVGAWPLALAAATAGAAVPGCGGRAGAGGGEER